MDRKIFVTLVRHGETALNVQRLLQGHTNTPLSEVGTKQAELLGKRLAKEKFSKVYSSDLSRAHSTARIILENSDYPLEIQKDRRLLERCYGEAEGKPVKNLFDQAAERNLNISDYTPNGGEPVADVMKRAEAFFQDLCKLCDENANIDFENVLVVTHGGWIQYLLKCLYKDDKKYTLANFDPSKAIRIHQNTAVSKLSISGGKNTDSRKYFISFLAINDSSHLSH